MICPGVISNVKCYIFSTIKAFKYTSDYKNVCTTIMLEYLLTYNGLFTYV